MTVADFFIRRVDRAYKRRIGQCRFQLRTFGGGQHLLLLRIGQALARMVEAGGIAEGHQFAVAPPVETDEPVILAPAFQRALAEQRQTQQMRRVFPVDRGAAGGEKRRHPAPLRRVQTRAQLERRVAAQHPADRLQRHAGISQRRHIAVGQLAAVGEAGFAAQRLPRLDHCHFETVAHQRPGRCQPDHAAADDAHTLSHVRPYFYVKTRLRLG